MSSDMGGFTFRSRQDTICPICELGDAAEDNDTRVVRHHWEARDQHVLHGLDAQLHLQKMLAICLLHQGLLVCSYESAVVASKGDGIRVDACDVDEIVLALDIPDNAVAHRHDVELLPFDAHDVLYHEALLLQRCLDHILKDEARPNLEPLLTIKYPRPPGVGEATQLRNGR